MTNGAENGSPKPLEKPPETAQGPHVSAESASVAQVQELSAEKFKAEFDEMKSRLERTERNLEMVPPPVPRWDKISKVLSSGVFFIALGIAFLYVASKYMGSEHSTFSFVLVTLGTAIVLYGTGTQGMGEFKSDPSTAAKLNVAIAGGAGVLAFCVAYGIINYQEKMKTAFHIEKKYFVLRVGPNDDASTKFDRYVAKFSIDGLEIPVMKRGDFFLVYVPYLESEKSQKRNIDFSFYYVGPADADSALRRDLHDRFPVTIEDGKFPTTDSGSDFPLYTDTQRVDLRAPAGSSLANAGNIAPLQHGNVSTAPPVATPPVALLPESKV